MIAKRTNSRGGSSALAPDRKFFSFGSLRRITTSGKYIPEIDGLRFVAIAAVVLFHLPVQLPLHSPALDKTDTLWHLISHGGRGVELFFLISGFILALPFASQFLLGSKQVNLQQYYLRRVTRLEPPYIVSILVRLPLLVLVMHQHLAQVAVHGLASLVYLHSLIFSSPSTVNPPAWSLEVEIQFYCLAPLFAWAYFSLRPKWFRRACAIAFILLAGILQIHFFGDVGNTRASLSILNYVQYFFSGFVLCDLYLTDWQRLPAHWAWDIVSTIAWCWIFVADGNQVQLFLPLVALVAYIGAFKGAVFSWFFRLQLVSLIGGMCYSIYLTHNLAIAGARSLLHRLVLSAVTPVWEKTLVTYVIAAMMALVLGFLLYITVERPCMDKAWPTKLLVWLRSGRSSAVPTMHELPGE